jgi:hypothetical protein
MQPESDPERDPEPDELDDRASEPTEGARAIRAGLLGLALGALLAAFARTTPRRR